MLALSGEKKPANATIHTIPRLVDLLKMVYGASSSLVYLSEGALTERFESSGLLILQLECLHSNVCLLSSARVASSAIRGIVTQLS